MTSTTFLSNCHPAPSEFETARLRLRRWTVDDRGPFAAMNADPVVMEHFPAPLTREQSDAVADRIQDTFDRYGFGWWAMEVKAEPGFRGFVGLSVPRFEAAFTPCVEIGWRLSRDAWGHGYATEAAMACLDVGFRIVGLADIVSFTAVQNLRSRRVMERIGMQHSPEEEFDHPALPGGHRLSRHVLYRIRNPELKSS